MTGLSARNRTLGELMSELRARLGFQSQGSAAKANDPIIKSFLTESHEYVFGELEPPVQRKKAIINTEAGSYLYDWHNDADDEDINPGRVLSVFIKVGNTEAQQMTQGITNYDRADGEQREQPRKYDTLNGQMEIWPLPERAYEITVEYIAERARFTQTADRCSVPDRLVFLYALATAKAHYRHPDAQASATAFQNMLSREKGRQRENRRYFVNGSPAGSGGLQVVRTADGYKLGAS